MTALKTLQDAIERDSKLKTANNLQALQIQELRKIIDNRPLQKAADVGRGRAPAPIPPGNMRSDLENLDLAPTQEEKAATAGRPGAPMAYRDDSEETEEAVGAMRSAVTELADKHFGEISPNALQAFKADFEFLLQQVCDVEKYASATECDTLKITKSFGVSYERDTGRFDLNKAADGFYISGYVSDGSLDRDGDRMSQNALKMMESAMKGGMALFADHEHGAFDTLGHFTQAKLDGKGLWAEAKLENPETNQNVKSLISKLESGIPLGFSIGGDMDGSKMVKETDETGKSRTVREISGVKLYEVSVVGLPSNPNARITNLR